MECIVQSLSSTFISIYMEFKRLAIPSYGKSIKLIEFKIAVHDIRAIINTYRKIRRNFFLGVVMEQRHKMYHYIIKIK